MRQSSFFLLFVVITILGCSSPPKEYEPVVIEPVKILYDRALASMAEGKYGLASKQFDEVELQHPYSSWAARATLMSGYALYLKDDYSGAILGFERYIELYPDQQDRAYAEYMIGQSYFDQIVDVGRDQFLTVRSAEHFARLIAQFPDSEYAKDARVKYDLTQDQIAGKHMEIGRFYQKKMAHTGAINRFSQVVKHYDTTSHVPEALFRLTESNMFLGLQEDAQMSAAVLGHNYPNSKWYHKAYQILMHNRIQPKE